jgi:hypothetical protein
LQLTPRLRDCATELVRLAKKVATCRLDVGSENALSRKNPPRNLAQHVEIVERETRKDDGRSLKNGIFRTARESPIRELPIQATMLDSTLSGRKALRHVLLVLAAASVQVFAQQPAGPDKCKDILQKGAFNQTNAASAESANRAMYAQLCASTYSQAQTITNSNGQDNGGMNLGIGWDSFGFNFGGTHGSSGAFSQNQFNAWQASHCNTTSSANASSAADYLMQHIASTTIAEAWAQCMANIQGLSCWASPYGAQDAEVTLNWKQESTTKLSITMTDLSDGAASRYDRAPKGKLLPRGIKLDPGVIQVPLTRQAGKSVLVSVNGNHAGENVSCSAYIPSDSDFKLQTVVAAPMPQMLDHSPDLGCDVQALGAPCLGSWASTAPPNYKVCSTSLQYTAGPTHDAQMSKSTTATSVNVQWRVTPSPFPFGPGQWVHARVNVIYVPNDRSTDDNGNVCGG